LSFPRPGYTLALDYPATKRARRAMAAMDEIVKENGGRIYPAKDARMAARDFKRFYPQWESFASHVDPGFSSSLWRRVTGDGEGG